MLVAVAASLSFLVAAGSAVGMTVYIRDSKIGTDPCFTWKPGCPGKPPVTASGEGQPPGPCINNVCNYLLLGSDSRAGLSPSQQKAFGTNGQSGGGYNSDVIMLVHTDPSLQKAIILSFPRDLWVNIPGHGEGKINSSFGLGGGIKGNDAGGPSLVARTVSAITGLKINHYLYVDLKGFEGVVNTLNGVDMCISSENVNTPGYVAGTDAQGQPTSTYYSEAGHIVDPNTGLDVVPGCQRLNAQQALAYVRTRHLPCDAVSPDYFRIGRQQQFLRAVLNRMLQPTELAQLQSLIGPILSSMRRDSELTIADLAYLVGQLRGVSTGAVEFRSVPAYPITVNGLSALRMDPSAQQIFRAIRQGKPIGNVGLTPQYTPPSPANVPVAAVDHSSGGKVGGVEKVLAESGFDVGAGTQPYTGYGSKVGGNIIAYAPGHSLDAQVVQQYLPGLAIKEVKGLADPVAVFVTSSYTPAQVGTGGNTPPPQCVSPTG
jgi:LCP family protein required for cell wall assembly